MIRSSFLILALLLSPLAAFANDVGAPLARMAPPLPPEPPHHNPHAPQSAEDRRRVDFAVKEIHAYYGPGVELRHPHIIPWSFKNFLDRRAAPPPPPPSGDPNVIIEAQTKGSAAPMHESQPAPAMVGPALQSDEYMVHVYARFPGDPAWYHLDVILTEDAAGHLARRRFFRIPIPPVHHKLPPGVVC